MASDGWYPVDGDPEVVRWWDEVNGWGESRTLGRGRFSPPVEDGDPWYLSWGFLGVMGAIVVALSVGAILSASDDGGEVVAAGVTTIVVDRVPDSNSVAAPVPTPSVPMVPESTTTSEAPDDDDDVLPFGTPHERNKGVTGAGWTISIDEVRAIGLGRFVSDGFTMECTAVLGSATLRELDSEELVSNPFGFPSVVLVDQGASAETAVTNCDRAGLEAEGYVWRLDVSLAEGGEVKWFEVFETVVGGEYDVVAIESTVYQS